MCTIGPITYHVRHDRRDFVVEFDEDSRQRIVGSFKLPPHTDFIDALNAAHQQFCPHIPKDDRPWNIHAKIASSYKRILRAALARNVSGTSLKQRLNKIYNVFGQTPCPDLAKAAKVLAKLEDRLSEDERNGLSEKLNGLIRDRRIPLDSWAMTWYWRALFTALPAIHAAPNLPLPAEEDKPNIKVRILQVRNWTMVLVYSEEIGKDAETEDCIPIRKLLRPPLFGKSSRYSTWDQYFSICGFQRQISKAWERASRVDVEDVRSHRERWYVLGRHDMTFCLKDLKTESVVAGDAPIISAELSLSLDLYPFLGESWEVKERERELSPEGANITPCSAEDAMLRVHPGEALDGSHIRYPYDLVSIPVCHRERREEKKLADGKSRFKEERILLASDAVCHAYESLSEVWNDPTAKSVLIIAPSGSGKELLTESIHCFQQFKKGPYVRYALSPSMHERNDATLFGRDLRTLFEPSATSIEEKYIEALKKRNTELARTYLETSDWAEKGEAGVNKTEDLQQAMTDGLIFRAREGVLFLDEIDKVPEQTRSGLLRLLENDEFAVSGTSIVLKLEDWCPRYVFAGSLPRREMCVLRPLDFWTRISHVVEMAHPLDFNDQEERMIVAREYFCFFWMKHLVDFFKRADLLPFEYPRDVGEFFQQYYSNLCGMLNDYELVNSVASMFANEVEGGPAASEMSIRNIRSIVGRVLYGLVDYLLYSKESNSALDQLRRVEGDAGVAWFDLLGRLIKRSIGPRSEPGLARIEESCGERFRGEIGEVVRASIRKIG